MTRSKWARAILAAGAVVGALVWQSVQATRVGYEVERSRRRLGQLRSQLASRQVQWERLVAPAQLSQQARVRFNMLPADPSAIRILEPVLQPNLDPAPGAGSSS